ncbi:MULTISPECIES: GLPGLI family protein [Chryseobacterium group]|uniref:GLPGLI family protein n=1 Tax=Epilithonimonas vandammei TaxID=2487072 RepID=A0A3G8Y3M8_9FLAO|nr:MULTISPECIES: GLPGLI family protein [Chryseobacterium group]AZI39928.1 GLPGLI family protein [Epilithonimonas vandammei]QIY82696.1 GLPGLI family protein [Chryseobacterium sp. NEB161]RRQ46883.1 GLPGLI family protein [Chryseobacterium sp. SC28]
MISLKKISILLTFFLFAIIHSQTEKQDSLIADFTYLMRGKIYKSTPTYIHEELFSLQVIKDRAFFISEKSLKFDSIFQSEFQKVSRGGTAAGIDFRGKSFPKSKFKYAIIQSSKSIQYFENIGMSLLSYNEPIITNWKLTNESKTINSLTCKKAEVNYKGRNWIAWYSTEIPLSYGPYKFTGLPGLIIKISDESGDYDFELVKSVSSTEIKGKILTINKRRYEGAKETTFDDLQVAKKNFNENLIGTLANSETTIAPGSIENLRNIQKQKLQDLNDQNSIELAK